MGSEFNPFPNDKILESSKLEEFADNNFKFDDIGRKFAKQIETLCEKEKLLVFSKDLHYRHIKNRDCLGKG